MSHEQYDGFSHLVADGCNEPLCKACHQPVGIGAKDSVCKRCHEESFDVNDEWFPIADEMQQLIMDEEFDALLQRDLALAK